MNAPTLSRITQMSVDEFNKRFRMINDLYVPRSLSIRNAKMASKVVYGLCVLGCFAYLFLGVIAQPPSSDYMAKTMVPLIAITVLTVVFAMVPCFFNSSTNRLHVRADVRGGNPNHCIHRSLLHVLTSHDRLN